MSESGPAVGLRNSLDGSKGFGLYNSDARELKRTLSKQFGDSIKDGLVNVTITSPPYADQKDYGYDEKLQIGFGDDYEDYLDELRQVYKQVYDITAEDGSLWVVVNTHKRAGRTVRLPFDIADECENLEQVTHCEECGSILNKHRETGRLQCSCNTCDWRYNPLKDSWRLQDIVIWDKGRARPWSNNGRFRNVFEYILCFSKSKEFRFELDNIRIADPKDFEDYWINYPERYNPRGKVPDNIWEMVTPTQGGWGNKSLDHPAPFPTKLVERIAQLTTDEGDVVFDPFAGTGTVLAQAEAMGRLPVGFELSQEYVGAFPQLREELFEDWKDKKGEWETLRARQDVLAEKIWKLRQTIFPKKLLSARTQDQKNRSLDEIGLNTFFLLSHATAEEYNKPGIRTVSADLYAIVDNDVTEQRQSDLLDILHTARDEDPCRPVQVEGEIITQGVDAFLDRADADGFGAESLYLYDKNHHNYPSREVTLEWWHGQVRSPDEWRDERSASGYPPLISDIYVNTDADGAQVTDGLVQPMSRDAAKTQLRDF